MSYQSNLEVFCTKEKYIVNLFTYTTRLNLLWAARYNMNLQKSLIYTSTLPYGTGGVPPETQRVRRRKKIKNKLLYAVFQFLPDRARL